jgi:hypothetical protein
MNFLGENSSEKLKNYFYPREKRTLQIKIIGQTESVLIISSQLLTFEGENALRSRHVLSGGKPRESSHERSKPLVELFARHQA